MRRQSDEADPWLRETTARQLAGEADEWLRRHDPRYQSGARQRGYYTTAQEADPRTWDPPRTESADQRAERLPGWEPAEGDQVQPRVARCRGCRQELEVGRRGPWPTICARCASAEWRERQRCA